MDSLRLRQWQAHTGPYVGTDIGFFFQIADAWLISSAKVVRTGPRPSGASEVLQRGRCGQSAWHFGKPKCSRTRSFAPPSRMKNPTYSPTPVASICWSPPAAERFDAGFAITTARERMMAFGAAPLLSLADARAKRDEASTALCEGHEPNVLKRLKVEANITS